MHPDAKCCANSRPDNPAEFCFRRNGNQHFCNSVERAAVGFGIAQQNIGATVFYSPLCANGLNTDLAHSLGLPILPVAEDRVGCINHCLLALEAAHQRKLNIKAIVLNGKIRLLQAWIMLLNKNITQIAQSC